MGAVGLGELTGEGTAGQDQEPQEAAEKGM